ncbi:hypothetical protein [Zobellella maritima]|uniref:hypothetical protein n=1 Tax=Zobellella maritima TaxID=2059725 RepID=UPI000E3098BF|nr:hypothetical protein [Zobellella maritima]
MKCPSCQQVFRPSQVVDSRAHGVDVRFGCPHCRARLAVNGRATRIKLMGFVLMMAGSGVMLWAPERSWIFGSMVCIAGAVMAFSARRRELRLQWLDRPGSRDKG